MKDKNRLIWIDVIKVFAIFSVLLLHISAPIVDHFNTISMYNWHIGNFIDSSLRMAVPLFFMISGFLLLNSKEEDLNIFFRKRFLKVIIPLVIWSLLYILFRKYIQLQDISISLQVVKGFFSPRYFHLWFLYTILGIYLVLPILRIFIYHSNTKIQIYFLILWVYSFSIIPAIGEYTDQFVPNYLPMMSGFLGFLVLGYLLAKIKITKNIFYLSIILIIVSTFVTIWGTFLLSTQNNKFFPLFYHYSSLSTIVQSIGYFIFIKYISERYIEGRLKLKSIITALSYTSLGIYLIHPMILFLLKENGIYALNGGNLLYSITLTVILTYFLSFIIIYGMQRIPIIKKIVPS